ncbi:MAG: hypothetical protein J5716_02780 [Alphaproteobacteria bacterium]|nr:hypothetical protein [Alphaproteobacteria bacterium]
MRKIIYIFLALWTLPAAAQDMPPRCWEPYLYVQNYGSWSLNNGIWSLPFTCSSGFNGSVEIAAENVENQGYAEYYINAGDIENGKTFFYTEPCGAMGAFCQYVSLPRQGDFQPPYSLEPIE